MTHSYFVVVYKIYVFFSQFFKKMILNLALVIIVALFIYRHWFPCNVFVFQVVWRLRTSIQIPENLLSVFECKVSFESFEMGSSV